MSRRTLQFARHKLKVDYKTTLIIITVEMRRCGSRAECEATASDIVLRYPVALHPAILVIAVQMLLARCPTPETNRSINSAARLANLRLALGETSPPGF